MTRELFLARHSPEWAQLKDDLLAYLSASSLAHEADSLPMAVTEEQRTTLNCAFTDRLAGEARCRRLLSNLAPMDVVITPEEATFSRPPEAAYDPDRPEAEVHFPEMPAPKNRTRKTK
jgi:hypothetical protein